MKDRGEGARFGEQVGRKRWLRQMIEYQSPDAVGKQDELLLSSLKSATGQGEDSGDVIGSMMPSPSLISLPAADLENHDASDLAFSPF